MPADLDKDAIRARLNCPDIQRGLTLQYSENCDAAAWRECGVYTPEGAAVALFGCMSGLSSEIDVATFIAHAPTDLAALLADHDRLEGGNNKLRAALEEASSFPCLSAELYDDSEPGCDVAPLCPACIAAVALTPHPEGGRPCLSRKR